LPDAGGRKLKSIREVARVGHKGIRRRIKAERVRDGDALDSGARHRRKQGPSVLVLFHDGGAGRRDPKSGKRHD